jgi:putative NADH-flavin reductase
MYTALLAANDKLLKMAGMDTNKDKEESTKQTSVQLIINQINGARTERRVDVGGIAPIEVDYTIKS